MSEHCPHCDEKLKPCPFCGGQAKIYGENMVGCVKLECDAEMTSSGEYCSGAINYGHWCGEENGVPAVHWVIKAWNRRLNDE